MWRHSGSKYVISIKLSRLLKMNLGGNYFELHELTFEYVHMRVSQLNLSISNYYLFSLGLFQNVFKRKKVHNLYRVDALQKDMGLK